jgi:subtilase family serine protease
LKKGQCVSLVLLACLLLFVFGIPLVNSRIINEGGGCNSSWDYVVNPKYVDADSYTGRGILYNTVGELRAAYDLNSLYTAGYDGSGQTVVIVDAYGSPTIYDDLLGFITWQNTYAGAGLPWTTLAEVQSHLHIYYPTGKPTFNPRNWPLDEIGWSIETTLDVDMVHAIAPGADIALVVASSPAGDVLNLAVHYAIANHLGSVISQSFGIPEYVLEANNAQILQAHYNYWLASQPEYSITVFASTGDDGATNGGPYNNALYPASDLYCTGVGGTNLFMDCSDGFKEGTKSWDNTTHVGITYSYEIAGNDYEAMDADGYPNPAYGLYWVYTGGAMSSLFSLPSWQSGITLTYTNSTSVTPTGRCTSDVSFDSGVYGGLGRVPWSALGYTINYIVGGTSAGSPFWAALTALACQAKGSNLGYINPKLYAFSDAYVSGAFHDIKIGDNTYPHGGSILGYMATEGWDAPTGIGSPDAAILVPIMATW